MAHSPSPHPLLALNNVTVMRGEHPALQDITLRVEAGEHVCILGPNGCGKSTVIKTITRECYPLANEGSSISILGRERWNVFELRSLLGIVSPDLLASCRPMRLAATWCSPVSSAAHEFFRITRPAPIFSRRAKQHSRA
jgi:ABC-type molybdenum transport system ATPase subunit/photorepair protein PhrA